MFCVKCGHLLEDDAKFCPVCGQPVETEPAGQDHPQSNKRSKNTQAMHPQQQTPQRQQTPHPQQQTPHSQQQTPHPRQQTPHPQPEPAASAKKPEKKPKTGMIIGIAAGCLVAAIAIAAIIIFVGLGGNSGQEKYAEYMDEGQQYVDSQNYGAAEKAFLKAIDSAPKQKEAYIRLAEVYELMGDKTSAANILQDAINTAQLNDDDVAEISQKIVELGGTPDTTAIADGGNSASGGGNGSGDGNNVSDSTNSDDNSPSVPVTPLTRPQLAPIADNSSDSSGNDNSDNNSSDDSGNGDSGNDGSSTSASVPAYTVNEDLSNITNLEQFYFQPGSEEARLLSENMFFVTSGYNKEFFETYESNRYSLTPSFITVDSMMHTYHLYFSYLMKTTERDYLSSSLSALSQTMFDASMAQYEVLKGSEWETAALRNVAFFAVGASLQGISVSAPAEASDVISQELANINAASSINTSPLTGTMIDYSQFAPRGYYEGDEQLEAYFRAMMWYGQIGFVQIEEELDRSALLMTLAMNGDAYSAWESIYTVTSFFAGASDDLSYYEYLPAIEAAYGGIPDTSALIGNTGAWENFRSIIAAMDPPAINSIPTVDDHNSDTSSTEQNKGFRFMGQRFTIDAAIFQKLIYENVQPNSSGEKRMLPDTLDVAAALGSDTAYDILKSQGETDYANYTENMDYLRTSFENAPDSVWSASLYSSWLYTLKPLLETKGEGYPSFMQSTQWATKDLETFAGSYAELKHDTVLYAKQVMAEMGGGELPQWDDRGYVEPEVEVWARFEKLATKTAEGLKSYGLLSAQDEENLNRLAEMAGQFRTMSEKELANTLLSDEEYDLIRNYGGNLEHFWLEALKDEGENITSGDFPAAIVTDIATDPNGTCLEIATGNPSTIYVVVPIDGELHICEGAVYSFYQFEQPIEQRMTDDDWRQMMGIATKEDGTYSYDTKIDQPAWTQSYRYDRTY